MLELVRRGAVVAVWLAVYLRVLCGLALVERKHTARRSPARGRSPQPWGLEYRTARRVGGRLLAVRVQVLAL